MKRSKRLQNADDLKAAVGDWAVKIKARPRQIRIQRMTRKWASCSNRGRITFNSDLFDQPYGFQEFVIVHELLHLKIANHGKLFKSLLNAYLPYSRDHGKHLAARLNGDGPKAPGEQEAPRRIA